MSRYYFDSGQFVMEQFHENKPFASFLPGLAGLKGIPMWTFYVNRGQGISSFGVRDKNSPIMEFSPASISYKNVASSGFRTFIKLGERAEIYEPFQSSHPDPAVKRKMTILPNGLTIEEEHAVHGLKMTVHYFNLPNDDYAALVRRVEIENTGGAELSLELLDGLPEILPYGSANSALFRNQIDDKMIIPDLNIPVLLDLLYKRTYDFISGSITIGMQNTAVAMSPFLG